MRKHRRELTAERRERDLCAKYKRAFNWMIDNQVKYHPFFDKAMRRALTKRGVPFLDD